MCSIDLASRYRDGPDNPDQICRLVAPHLRLWLHRARQKIRRIRFYQQSVVGDLRNQRSQFAAAAVIADPAGNADVTIEFEIAGKLVGVAGETMHDGIEQR